MKTVLTEKFNFIEHIKFFDLTLTIVGYMLWFRLPCVFEKQIIKILNNENQLLKMKKTIIKKYKIDINTLKKKLGKNFYDRYFLFSFSEVPIIESIPFTYNEIVKNRIYGLYNNEIPSTYEMVGNGELRTIERI